MNVHKVWGQQLRRKGQKQLAIETAPTQQVKRNHALGVVVAAPEKVVTPAQLLPTAVTDQILVQLFPALKLQADL